MLVHRQLPRIGIGRNPSLEKGAAAMVKNGGPRHRLDRYLLGDGGMNNKRYKRDFTPSDDALILEQPVTGIGLKTLATMLGTSGESRTSG